MLTLSQKVIFLLNQQGLKISNASHDAKHEKYDFSVLFQQL